MTTGEYGNPFKMVAVSLLVFPKLALGLSGFETGVAVMPLVQGEPGDTELHPLGTDPEHAQAAHDGGGDHERDAGLQQHHHDTADSGGGVS